MTKKWFRLAGYLEAISCILLFAVAMPLKYFWAIPNATKIPGLIHGLLFLIYVSLAQKVSQEEGWDKRKLLAAYLASILPLGTLVYDQKFLQFKQEA